MALIARITRASMLDVLAQDYIRTAQAKGLAPTAVLVGHALQERRGADRDDHRHRHRAADRRRDRHRDACSRFPGIGRLTVDAILRRDYPVIQGVILIFSGVYVLINLLVDLSYMLLRSAHPLLTWPPSRSTAPESRRRRPGGASGTRSAAIRPRSSAASCCC